MGEAFIWRAGFCDSERSDQAIRHEVEFASDCGLERGAAVKQVVCESE